MKQHKNNILQTMSDRRPLEVLLFVSSAHMGLVEFSFCADMYMILDACVMQHTALVF
jgi:hypothetical protein